MGKEAEYRSIGVNVVIDEDTPEILTNRGRLQQILLNVTNNAFAAVDDGGHIDIAVGRKGSDEVLIKVTDDGCGMSEDQLARVFEPFFTTKRGSGGVGLGLSITYSLVTELGGSVSVESELWVGTSFLIRLPVDGARNESVAR